MLLLSPYPTVGEVRDFLLDVIDSADDRQSKVNPSFTKEQMWNLHMGIVIKVKDDSQPFMKSQTASECVVNNLNREFGSR